MKLKLIIPIISVLTAPLSFGAGDSWMTNFEAAKKKAADENKSLLIDFTGSDWCGWCIKLNEEVFQHEAFDKGVADTFVLVELDYPQDRSKLTEETIKQNAELQELYQIQGFPTILLTDAEGKPFAQTGYQQGGPEAYVTHLNELLKTKTKLTEALAKGEKAEGVEKAKALYEALQIVPEDQHHHYSDLVETIKANDPDDTTGLVAAEKEEAAMGELEVGMQAAMQSGDSDKALKLVDDYIATYKPTGKKLQETMGIKLNVFYSKQDFDGMEKVVDEMIAVDPDSEMSAQIKAFKDTQLKALRAQVEQAEKAEKEEPAEESAE